jgi:hypothetical protein
VLGLELRSERKVDWVVASGCPKGFEPRQVYAGRDEGGGSPIEVAVARWQGPERVTREAMAKLHALRVNKRATSVVLAVELDNGTVITFGPNASAAPLEPLEFEQAQRLFQAVLDEPNALLARTRLAALSQAIDSTTIPGVKNSGLFANHELRVGVPQRDDWRAACAASAPLLVERGPGLIAKLGYTVSRAGAHALVLTGKGPRPQAIAVMLDEREAFDTESQRFSISPVAYGLTMAEREGVPWLIMARGSQLRLYPARVDLGVGRKGLAETFFEVDLPYLTIENAGYLTLLYSADALEEGGTTFQIMAASSQYAVALGGRLRDKVYEEIIPDLSLAVAEQMIDLGYEMDAEGLDLAYQTTLRIFFRLLFQVYAEDRKLLPYKENDKYTRNALKTVAQDMVDNPDEEFDPESATLWDDLAQVWRVIDTGDRAWGVPAYNGGLFASDLDLNPHGALIAKLRITNDVMGPVLRALLLDDGDDGEAGPIDFRSLSVREFGTIYEGLLESSLGLAEVDLTLDDKGTWLPAKKKSDEIYAEAGQVYFHNTSGQRKGTGSYFTPSFVVEHLLERSLDPALDEHLARVAELIKTGDQASAADLFFDFKVADLAMGSGHFLTAAIDHIEAKMAAFLAEDGNQIAGVAKELMLLFQAAKDAIGPDAPEPEPSSLLRRQIARRCVYGLDINPIAVELARVSIWIHTFVRGLPMSSLDHNLVCANSLTGIGSLDEALDVLVPDRKGAATFYDAPIEEALEMARSVLVDAANSLELNRKESQAAAKAVQKARQEAETARLLFDAAVLARIGRERFVFMNDVDAITKAAGGTEAQEALSSLRPAHMPVLFPEVFLRSNGGFDVLVGNPPWEKLKVEEHQWWGLRFPGLRSMPMAERTKRVTALRESRPDLEAKFLTDVETNAAARAVIASGPYPGIGSGDIDLYQAFAWRNWHCLRDRGALGLVLPRGAFSGSGTEQWRRSILAAGTFSSVVFGTNTRGWLFPAVHPQYTIGLVCARRGSTDRMVQLGGSYYSKLEFEVGRKDLATVGAAEFTGWTATAAFPLIPNKESGAVFRQMRSYPSLVGGRDFDFRRVREIESTDKKLFSVDLANPLGPVPVITGASFNVWEPDFGDPYAYASVDVEDHILSKILRSAQATRSAFHGLDIRSKQDLPMRSARIMIRDVCRPTDTRTAIACLMPPGVTSIEKAPYLLRRSGESSDEAYVLGVLCSIPFDWYARRIVELSMTLEILSSMPIPRPDRSDPRRRRVVELAARLAAKDARYSTWAKAVGVPVGSFTTETQRAAAEAEIDALVAHLYGLSREQVEHIFVTFHRGWEYRPRLDAVLAFFDETALA